MSYMMHVCLWIRICILFTIVMTMSIVLMMFLYRLLFKAILLFFYSNSYIYFLISFRMSVASFQGDKAMYFVKLMIAHFSSSKDPSMGSYSQIKHTHHYLHVLPYNICHTYTY